MSYADTRGVQLDPADLRNSKEGAECAWVAARAIIHDDRLPERQRLRLMWAVLDSVATPQAGVEQ